VAPVSATAQDAALTGEQAKAIARDAYVFAYPLVMNYRTMYMQAIKGDGRFGKWLHLGFSSPADTDTSKDRKAIQSVINQVVFYPLKDFDGKMKTKDWAQAPAIPGPKSEGGGETKWVVPEKFFDQLGTVLDTMAPLPGEETLYGQFRVLLDAAAKDPAIKHALVASAVETEREIIDPFFEWKRNERSAGNGWNRSTNNACFGYDYYNRTGTAKSNMFDNKPTETQYF
jgi:hypothetical protein